MAQPAASARFIALSLSLGLHALLIAGLTLWANRSDANRGLGNVAVDTVVLDDDVKLSLADDRPAGPTAPSRARTAEDQSAVAAPPPIQRVVDAGPVSVVNDGAKGVAEESERSAAVPLPGGLSNAGPRDGASGPPTFFRAAARGQSVVYVIDRSLSMGLSGALSAAKREVIRSIESLPETMRFQVIFYNRRAEPIRLGNAGEWLTADTSAKRQVGEWIKGLRAEGATDHVPALRRALLLRPDTIFFLTDADDLTVQQIRTITSLNQGRSVIHTIQLGPSSGHGEGALSLLARANSGTFRVPDLPGE